MNQQLFGMNEIYDCIFRATSNMEIGNKTIQANEPILSFDNIQVMSLNQSKRHSFARGGYDNRLLLEWDINKEINLQFSQGVISKMHMAFKSDSALNNQSAILVPMYEHLESYEESGAIVVELKQAPVASEGLFMYKLNGDRVGNCTVSGKKITFTTLPAYTELDIYYSYNYNNGGTIINIGRPLIKGFISMSAKTRVKDEETGKTVTGIINIPKLRIMSDFSMKLGKDIIPMASNFSAKAFPIGSKGDEKVIDFITLNDDIDSDF